MLVHLASGALVGRADGLVLLGPPGVGRTRLGIPLGYVAARYAGCPVLSDNAGWLAQWEGPLAAEIKRPRKDRLLATDEVRYISFGQDAANLFFQVIAARYESGSLMITLHMRFRRWGEVFGNDVMAAAMIDRLVSAPRSSPFRGRPGLSGHAVSCRPLSPRRRPARARTPLRPRRR